MKRFCFFTGCVTPLILFGILVVSFIVINLHWDKSAYDSRCPSNLRQIALGIFMYGQDYDGKLPPAIFPGKTVGWANGLQPYLKSYALLQCPLEQYNQRKYYSIPSFLQWLSYGDYHETPPAPNKPRFTSYWLNSNIAGLSDKEVIDPTRFIMLGDGDGNSPESTASYAIDHLPSAWIKSSDSPAKRHNGGAMYAFADGHVEYLSPDLKPDTSYNPEISVNQRKLDPTFVNK